MKKIITIIIFITVIIFITPFVKAQQVSLSISPPLLETIIKPGKSIMVAYDLKNFGDPVYLLVKVVSFEPKDNLGNVRLKNELEGPIKFSLDNANVQFERPFFLKTEEKQQILLRIKVPENISQGDYYYTLIAETIPSGNLNNNSISYAKASIGSNILITVTDSGIIDIKPKIVIFDVLSKVKIFNQKINIFDSFDKIPVILILENKGKNFIKPEGEIVLKNIFGHQLKYKIIPKNILSQSQRLIEASSSASINESDKFKNSSFVLSGFFIGKNNLSAEIFFGENSPKVFAKASFFAFPFKLISILIILLIVASEIIKKIKKNEED
ncbi:MAG: hypothetical protein NZM02_00425 [Patescibacteria group bacterium]|nr:hypothetical protein [Patescibacteria group bacterium]